MKKLFLLFAISLLAINLVAAASTMALAGKGPGITVEGFSVIQEGKLTLVEGTIYKKGTDENLGAGIPIEVHCIHSLTDNIISEASLLTNTEGYYTAYTENTEPTCVAGDQAYIKVLYNGNTYTSPMIDVASSDDYDFASVNEWIEIPEFTAIGMGIAILGIGFIVYKRRK